MEEKARGEAMSEIRVGHTEGGYSFAGGDPSAKENWKKVGAVEDGHIFQGGDPSEKDNWAPHIVKDQEADLGIVNRAKYSIEPIQSNRKALLEEALGKDNVLQDSKGELFIKQNGAFHPVNKDGASAADAADFAGALPEMAGGAIGTAAGAIAGLGPASPATAVIGGAVGAGAGSAIRQGLSAAIGNPQVATAGERAAETGMSAAMGGAAGAAGHYLKPVLAKAKTGITQFIKGASKEAADTVGATTSKTVAHTTSEMAGHAIPEYAAKSADDIMGEVADHSGRDVVQENAKKLAEIAQKEGLPAPSYAQAAQGKAIIAENQIMDTPLIGGKIKQQADKQVKLVTNNLEKITGRKIDFENDVHHVGQTVKEMAETTVAATKKVAQELYDKVDEMGANAMIGKKTLVNKFKNEAAKHGLIDMDGKPVPYDVSTEMTEETFNKLQKVVMQGLNALERNPSPKIRFGAANSLVKTLKANAKELKASNPDGHRRIIGFVHEMNSTLEGTLNREAHKLGEVFRTANSTWKKYKAHDEIYQELIGDTADQHVVKNIMQSTKKIEGLKEIIGEERVKEIGKSFVAETLHSLTKSGVARADSAKAVLRKALPQLHATIGKEATDSLMNNLTYLSSTGRPLTATRASLNSLLEKSGGSFKGLAVKLAGTAKTLAESKGTTVTRAIKDKAIETTSKTIGSGAKAVDKNISGVANLLGDNLQRGASSYPSKSLQMVSDKNDEKSQRARIISGRRAGAK